METNAAEPAAAPAPALSKPPVPTTTIVACVLACIMGVALCVQAIASMRRELKEDEKIDLVDLDDRSPAELEAERLENETERLRAEKAQLVRECNEVEERLAALSARAPKMPFIATYVASAEGERVIGLAAGADDRIEQGFQFAILRDKKPIARVVASVVGPRGCACRILVVKAGEKIRVGDEAVTKLD